MLNLRKLANNRRVKGIALVRTEVEKVHITTNAELGNLIIHLNAHQLDEKYSYYVAMTLEEAQILSDRLAAAVKGTNNEQTH